MVYPVKRKTTLLLHCEGGGIPYLTPCLWRDFVKNQIDDNLPLMLGLELSDTFVSPVYADGTKVKKKLQNSKKRPRDSGKDGVLSSKHDLVGFTFKGKKLDDHLRVYKESGHQDNIDIYLPVMIVPAFDLVTKAEACTKPQVISSVKEVSIPTSNGHIRVNPESYFSDVILPSFINTNKDSALVSKSQHYLTLYDDVVIRKDTVCLHSEKWLEKKKNLSVERTINWCTDNSFTNNGLGSNNEENNKNIIQKWAAIVGGHDKDLRKRCVHEVISRDMGDLSGVAFVGLHRVHQNDSELYRKILKDCLNVLPSQIESCVLHTSSIEELIHAAIMGVNVIGCSLPTLWARSSFAVSITFSNYLDSDATELLDLSDTKYARDKSPLSPACSCQTCQRHSRSYIHHLVQSKELLADILLFYHNLFQLIELFRCLNSN